jgi:glutamyl endopeptidase
MIMLVLAVPLGRFDIVSRSQNKVSTNNLMVQAVAPQGMDRIEHFSIFDQDDRFPILDTHRFPWSAVALVRTYWTADDLVGKACSGWMVGPSALVTAAHCIYDHGYPHHVIVKPAMNSDDRDETPFGTCDAVGGVVPEDWIQHRSKENDYGVYRLDCSVGRQTGTLGFKVTGGDGAQMPVQLTGYPNDKQGRTMWSGVGKVTSSSAKGMYFDADMWPGQSGGPIWDYKDVTCYDCVVAINSCEFTAPERNFGVRIDLEVFEFLLAESGFDPAQPDVSLHSSDSNFVVYNFLLVNSNAD